MMRSASAAAVLLGFACAGVGQAAVPDASCWRSDEVRAARIQNLQNTFMIDALKCRDTIPATADSYNEFLSKRRDPLLADKYTVQAHFVRLLGPVAGMNAATDYDTQASNRLSTSPIDVKRCETTALYARLAASATDDDLLVLASMLGSDQALSECSAPTAAPAVSPRPTAMVIPIWKKPPPVAATAAAEPTTAPRVAAASTAAAPSADPAARTAALIAEVRRQQQATAPTPLAVSVPAPAAAPVMKTDEQQRAETLKALQAAAAALAQAAEAMKPAASTSGLATSE